MNVDLLFLLNSNSSTRGEDSTNCSSHSNGLAHWPYWKKENRTFDHNIFHREVIRTVKQLDVHIRTRKCRLYSFGSDNLIKSSWLPLFTSYFHILLSTPLFLTIKARDIGQERAVDIGQLRRSTCTL
jgi:hypothetical protein